MRVNVRLTRGQAENCLWIRAQHQTGSAFAAATDCVSTVPPNAWAILRSGRLEDSPYGSHSRYNVRRPSCGSEVYGQYGFLFDVNLDLNYYMS